MPSLKFIVCNIIPSFDVFILGLKDPKSSFLIPRNACLYLGAKTENHIPFKSRFAAWEEMGIKVIPVLSKPTNDEAKGEYIQVFK